jgi:hypothetical protein
MHQGGSILVSLRVYMCRERVLMASVLYRLDCVMYTFIAYDGAVYR